MSTDFMNRAGVRYEVACELIGHKISEHAAAIAAEEAKAMPDAAEIGRLQHAQNDLDDERDALNSRDSEAIERVIEKHGAASRQSAAQ